MPYCCNTVACFSSVYLVCWLPLASIFRQSMIQKIVPPSHFWTAGWSYPGQWSPSRILFSILTDFYAGHFLCPCPFPFNRSIEYFAFFVFCTQVVVLWSRAVIPRVSSSFIVGQFLALPLFFIRHPGFAHSERKVQDGLHSEDSVAANVYVYSFRFILYWERKAVLRMTAKRFERLGTPMNSNRNNFATYFDVHLTRDERRRIIFVPNFWCSSDCQIRCAVMDHYQQSRKLWSSLRKLVYTMVSTWTTQYSLCGNGAEKFVYCGE